MSRIHQISHNDEFIRKKVNFFADYFDFAAENIGVLGTLEIENTLALIEKTIFQIDTNVDKCAKYIDLYLSHPALHREFLSNSTDRHAVRLSRLLLEYNSSGARGKSSWIKAHPQFKDLLSTIRRSLRIKAFKRSLKDVVSFLRCVHPMEHHKVDLINQTNMIISEFVLNDRSKKDLGNIFERILSREIDKFPFPKGMAEQPNDVKEDFIKNRTFVQQFDGIYNDLRKPLNRTYFVYRVYGLDVSDTFSFKYGDVHFYSPKHPRLTNVLAEVEKSHPFADFLQKDNPVVAVVRAESRSIDVTVSTAIEELEKAVLFINKVSEIRCRLERYSYLFTSDFVNIGWSLNHKERPYKINDHAITRLKDNPFEFLRRVAGKIKEVILRNEPLYINAISSKNVATYWQYLESIIPNSKIVETVALILTPTSEKTHKRILHNQIVNSLIQADQDRFGLSKKQFNKLILRINKSKRLTSNNLMMLRRHCNHLFLNHVLDEYQSTFTKADFIRHKQFYSRTLWEAYAQRNSYMHSGVVHDKSIIQLTGSLPRLITRLRVQIFAGFKNKLSDSYPGMINALAAKGEVLTT